MLTFKPVDYEDIELLRKYYVNCNYRLCEYSVGTKLMWRNYLHPEWTEIGGCLVVRNTIEGRVQFDYPVPGEDGDEDIALNEIERYCTDIGIRPVLSVVPKDKADTLLLRYPHVSVSNERPWKDYLYHAEDLAQFAGRRYSGQRNHINKFRREHPCAYFVPITKENHESLRLFWDNFEGEFHKDSDLAKEELRASQELFDKLDTGAFVAGGLLSEGKLLAVSLAEKCGDTLVTHIEKALYSQAGVYPTIVQSFVAHYGADCQWVNREDDARDKGLRTSKLQYLPAELGSKLCFEIGNELDALQEIPKLATERLILTAFDAEDKPVYNALCLDDDRNRWWGYDYRTDLQGALTEDYFLHVVAEDFEARRAVNFAIRLGERCIGEAVLYNCDWHGGMELGCRIAQEYAGNGYGTEAFAAVADWALYKLGLAKVVAKCYHENKSSYRMLGSCMRQVREDQKFVYFEKNV